MQQPHEPTKDVAQFSSSGFMTPSPPLPFPLSFPPPNIPSPSPTLYAQLPPPLTLSLSFPRSVSPPHSSLALPPILPLFYFHYHSSSTPSTLLSTHSHSPALLPPLLPPSTVIFRGHHLPPCPSWPPPSPPPLPKPCLHAHPSSPNLSPLLLPKPYPSWSPPSSTPLPNLPVFHGHLSSSEPLSFMALP